MGDRLDFYDLTVWKKAHAVCLQIYHSTKNFPQEEKYSLTNQLRRAASSVTANISEGYGRYHYKDRTRFMHLARVSNKEVQNFLLLAKDLGYLDDGLFNSIWGSCNEVERLINGFIRALNRNN